MRIHSDTLTQGDLATALREAGLGQSVWLDHITRHHSRSKAHAFEVRLAAVPGKDYNGKTRRPPNGGTFGAAGGKGATYDEWGRWIEHIFRHDADAIVGPYKGLDDFRRHHGGKYRPAAQDH